MNVYEIITARIQEQLEQGVIPWSKPWDATVHMPRNLSTKKAYRGVNVWLLIGREFESPWWVSFKQCKALGGTVNKGEKGTPVVFWKWLEQEKTEDADPEGEGTSGKARAPLLRYYTVFNVEQTTIPAERIPVPERQASGFSPIERCESIVSGMPAPPVLRNGGTRAFYRPGEDLVNMPVPERFRSSPEYYSTLFHELVHSTGHPGRLNRQTIKDLAPFGSPNYSREELIAEMGAAFLCGVAGIENATIENSAAYIKGWLRALEDDSRLVVLAASQAQKAAEYILDRPWPGDVRWDGGGGGPRRAPAFPRRR